MLSIKNSNQFPLIDFQVLVLDVPQVAIMMANVNFLHVTLLELNFFLLLVLFKFILACFCLLIFF